MVEDVTNKFKISVWWDIENCHVPKDVDPHYIAQNMAAALQHADLTGPIEIQVFGDTTILSRATQKALSDTGITLNHVPRGNKDAADKAILVNMLLWALDNPPPANILLISGDGDFASALHRLRLKTYSILLAVPPQTVKPALTGAAKRLWFWKDMAKGQLAEPERTQAGSNVSKDLVGSFAMETFPMRQKSFSAGTAGSAVSNGYASPQKKFNGLEHFRSMSLEDHPNLPSPGLSSDDRNRNKLCERKVSPGRVCSMTSSDNVTANINHSPISAACSVDFGQHSNILSQHGGRVEPLITTGLCNYAEVSNHHLPHHANTSTNFLPRGPLQHIAPYNTRSVNNIPILQNPIPKDNVNRINIAPTNTRSANNLPISQNAISEEKVNRTNIIQNNASRNYQYPKAVTPLLPTTSSLHSTASLHSTVVAKNEEKLLQDNCVDKIYCAMKTLERDMLAPTESNLSDCIQYWDPQYEKMYLKQALKKAVDLQQVTKTQLRGGLIMYFPPNHMVPWNCVDPGSMSAVHSEDVWLELHHFLLHNERKQAFLCSSSRYSAGLILKSACGMHIQNLVVGKILNLLEQAIQVRKWLWKNGPGWGPLILNHKLLLDWYGEISKADWRRATSSSSGIASGLKPAVSGGTGVEKDALYMKLRSFLSQKLKDGAAYNLSCLAKDFELASGIALDHQKLGFATLHELIKSLSDLVSVETTDSGFSLLRLVKVEKNSVGLTTNNNADKENYFNALSQTRLVQELKKWLCILLSNVKDGYDLSRVQQDFFLATGWDLSKEGIAFEQLYYVLEHLADVVRIVKSPAGPWLVYPACDEVDGGGKGAANIPRPITQ